LNILYADVGMQVNGKTPSVQTWWWKLWRRWEAIGCLNFQKCPTAH